MAKVTAYAWASGLIEFGQTLPNGALPIITGEENRIRDLIDIHARQSRAGSELHVPGDTEASNQQEGCKVLMRFTDHITREYIEK